MTEFHICDKCLTTNVKSLTSKLKKLAPNAEIKIGCQSYCGPGRHKAFVFINNRPISATNEDELMIKIAQNLK